MVDLGKKKARVTVRKHMKTEMFYLDKGIQKGLAIAINGYKLISNFQLPFLLYVQE